MSGLLCRLLVQSYIRPQPHFAVITCFLQKTARSVCKHHTTLRKFSSSRLSSVQSVETSAWIITESVQLISWRLFSMLAEFGCFVHVNACFSLIESPLYKFVTADNSLVWSTSYIPTITRQLLECVVHPWNTSIQRPSGGMSYIHFNTSQESGLSLSRVLRHNRFKAHQWNRARAPGTPVRNLIHKIQPYFLRWPGKEQL